MTPVKTLFRKVRGLRFRYEPLVSIVIRRDRILHNLRQFERARQGVAVAPVLKANAYGHGLVQVAKIFAGAGTTGAGPLPFLCVDTYAEALILRNEGIRTPLLVIGYTPLPNIERSALKDVAFGVMSMEELRRLAAHATRAKRRPVAIHLKIDTGMHRQGILPEDLEEALGLVARHPSLALRGAYSHLAEAGVPGSALTKAQIARWNAAARTIKAKFPSIPYLHLAATSGSRVAAKMDANVLRIGIGLYGIETEAPRSRPRPGPRRGRTRATDLLPALEMRTRITSVRKIAAGENVGYGAAFRAKRPMTVASIPVGYAEGLDRRLSNKGSVTVRGVACPIVGLVNMNIASIDVTRVPDATLDDEVLVISADRAAPNSVERMAKLCGTIPYEILVHLSGQVRRTVN